MSLNKSYTLVLISIFFWIQSFGQKKVIPLWEKVPNQKISNEQELIKHGDIVSVSNVQNPSFEVFLAPKQLAIKKAVIIFPGGGYGNLGIDYEGTDFAKWLNSKGITAFVLKYRLPNSKTLITPHLAPLQDAQRAIRLIRYNASKWNIDKDKIGLLGFSAGGHLASTLATQYNYKSYKFQDKADKLSARPDFIALIYPVISMNESLTHKGSKFNLLGEKPSKKMIDFFSNELQVSKKTPSTFILHCTDDKIVPIENSLLFFKALKENNIPAEIHIYPKGGHGFAFAKDSLHLNNWPVLLSKWLINLN